MKGGITRVAGGIKREFSDGPKAEQGAVRRRRNY